MPQLETAFTEAEKSLLIRLLETSLGETRTEAHRTHFSPEYRQQVLDEEKQIREILEKLRSMAD